MLHESPSVTVSTCDGIATVRLHFPAPGVNRWNATWVRELEAALNSIEREPAIGIAVIRSGLPAGFSDGFDDSALNDCRDASEAASLARAGQRLCAKLQSAAFVSVAFLEGPCVGPGWDVALACDDRLAVAGPDSAIGFGRAPTGWGGASLLGRKANHFHGTPLTPREAVKLGAIHHAFCERRAKIELQTWLDWRQTRLKKRSIPRLVGLAAERAAFAEAARIGYPASPVESFPPLPRAITVSDRRHAIGYAARGVRVSFEGEATFTESDFTARGWLTPLEASAALARITVVPATDRRFPDGSLSPPAGPLCVPTTSPAGAGEVGCDRGSGMVVGRPHTSPLSVSGGGRTERSSVREGESLLS